MTLTATLTSMAARTIGVRADEVHGFEERQVINALARHARDGKLFKAKLGHRHVRFFKHESMRDLFMEQAKLAAFQAKHPVGDIGAWGPTRFPTGNAPWPADAPAVVPKGLKIQYGPSHPPRFQECVLPFVHGGLRCA